MERTLVSRTTAKGRTVETWLTDEEAIAVCMTLPSSFAHDLVAKSYGRKGLSWDQMTWVHILAIEHLKKQEEPATEAIRFPGILSLFANTQGKLKFPKLSFVTEDGTGVVLQKAGERSRYPGNLHVSDGGPFGNNRYFGRIDTDGVFHEGRDCTGDILKLLEIVSKDPVGAARAYGHLTGCCCFCRQELTDERSTTVGYGPVCAKKWGLPWGEKPQTDPPSGGSVLKHPHAKNGCKACGETGNVVFDMGNNETDLVPCGCLMPDKFEECPSCYGSGRTENAGYQNIFCAACNGTGHRLKGMTEAEEDAVFQRLYGEERKG